jgi:hypothetical protein
MDEQCAGMAAFLESQTPKPESVPTQEDNTKKCNNQKVPELVGVRDKGLLATYEQVLVQNGFETPDLMMACTLHNFVEMEF